MFRWTYKLVKQLLEKVTSTEEAISCPKCGSEHISPDHHCGVAGNAGLDKPSGDC